MEVGLHAAFLYPRPARMPRLAGLRGKSFIQSETHSKPLETDDRLRLISFGALRNHAIVDALL